MNIDHKEVFSPEIAAQYQEVARRIREQPEPATQGRYIYIFRAGEYVKVGIALDPESRWKSIASCNPLLEWEGGFVTAHKYVHALFIERHVHAALAQYRAERAHCREWFKCDINIAVDALKRIIEGA